MADLIDRISGYDGEKINLHRFMALERLYALGTVTGAQVVAEFALTGDQLTQAAALANKIDSSTGALDKTVYVLRAESVLMCLEDSGDSIYHNADGTINKSKVSTDLLLS
ncbi:MAG: hypothetical protein WC455_24790 [Dehalococcoidia bacterium]|jgi:hypothetical protein